MLTTRTRQQQQADEELDARFLRIDRPLDMGDLKGRATFRQIVWNKMRELHVPMAAADKEVDMMLAKLWKAQFIDEYRYILQTDEHDQDDDRSSTTNTNTRPGVGSGAPEDTQAERDIKQMIGDLLHHFPAVCRISTGEVIETSAVWHNNGSGDEQAMPPIYSKPWDTEADPLLPCATSAVVQLGRMCKQLEGISHNFGKRVTSLKLWMYPADTAVPTASEIRSMIQSLPNTGKLTIGAVNPPHSRSLTFKEGDHEGETLELMHRFAMAVSMNPLQNLQDITIASEVNIPDMTRIIAAHTKTLAVISAKFQNTKRYSVDETVEQLNALQSISQLRALHVRYHCFPSQVPNEIRSYSTDLKYILGRARNPYLPLFSDSGNVGSMLRLTTELEEFLPLRDQFSLALAYYGALRDDADYTRAFASLIDRFALAEQENRDRLPDGGDW